ncbi:diaminopimelate decarboxylase [Desulfacinum hydrothermale DSM 13146]|uniref:Diaminopimelate decarboxylase n=1 Tax=Desulfacinum hydrothermale DSM 13146 TaxID=1121390 RepID=A0A1W1X8J1_9BACT|nr:diaminopimelate decarboxylase [Desulfacinum hydrothermale]SMC20137.1 diaminopimelate decarboxylase [Desulfacinum hydrothermale DSM 13146]
MHHFQYRDGRLYCEDVPVEHIAQEVGTPCYIYSHATLRHHFTVFDQAFAQLPHLTCYSVKANSNLSILRLFASLGAGVDIVSGGELFRARQAGIASERIVYSGVGKTQEEIDYALSEDILMFNIESSQELDAISQRAAALGRRARIALRVNPDVDPKTHPYITTGMEKNKFGVTMDEAVESYSRAARLPSVDVVGVDCHIGSQLTDVQPFVDALKRLRTLVARLAEIGIHIRFLDLGGGLGITYDRETPPHPTEYAQAIVHELEGLHCTVIFEPGRVIVGNAGILLTKVLYTKKTPKKHFVIVDAGMNDLIRPSLYGSYHHIQSVVSTDRPTDTVDVVGPICESGDFLARERALPQVEPGEYLAVMSAGAYGFTMASNYNSRPKAAEVLVRGDAAHVIRVRETWEDLVRAERIPEFLR